MSFFLVVFCFVYFAVGWVGGWGVVLFFFSCFRGFGRGRWLVWWLPRSAGGGPVVVVARCCWLRCVACCGVALFCCSLLRCRRACRRCSRCSSLPLLLLLLLLLLLSLPLLLLLLAVWLLFAVAGVVGPLLLLLLAAAAFLLARTFPPAPAKLRPHFRSACHRPPALTILS